ncbi:MAG: hypothetical protein JXA21_10110 [Anaerolineae bacterium]|nr:hypothetical protein [Anaerolineae bacterium]
MKHLYFGVVTLILLLSLFLTGCNSKPGAMEPYTSEVLGVTLDIPARWVKEEVGEQLMIANSAKSLKSSQVVNGAGLIIITMPLADMMGITDPVEILDIFQEELLNSVTNAEILQETAAYTIQEQPAATMKFKGELEGQPGIYGIIVLTGKTDLGTILSVDTTSDNTFADTLTQIVDSVKLQ